MGDYVGKASKPPQLCNKCQHIFNEWSQIVDAFEQGKDFVDYPHWEDAVAFMQSANNCDMCAQFFHQFTEEEMKIAGRERLGILKLYVTLEHPASEEFWHLSLYMPLLDGPAVSAISMGPAQGRAPPSYLDINPSTASENTLSLARQWLEECSQSHKSCKAPQNFTVPTRLLSIGQDRIFIIKSEEISGYPRYATLSHCWGELKILTLTKNNVSVLRDEVPHESLCKTFQDAIYTSRQLGFDYIWIDSLCIIQDDKEDWRRESALMSSVYGCSGLNIAAASAKDGSIGCFFDRVPKSVQALRISLTINDQERLYDFADEMIYQRCVSNTLLTKRAWVLQERVLAPRTLYFSQRQIFWQCRGKCACETFPEELPLRFYKGWDSLRWDDLSRQDSSLNAYDNKRWSSLHSLYTSSYLTYPSDRLVAISGIARWIHDQTKDEWVAGLWKRDLVLELCWHVSTSTPHIFRPLSYQAPSWSWASVEGSSYLPLKSPRITYRFLVQVLDINIMTVGGDSYGPVRSGVLRLRCGDIICGTHPRTKTNMEVIIGEFVVKFFPRLDEPQPPGVLLHFLPIYEETSLTTWSELKSDIRGLIVEPTKLEKGQFRRIGEFSVYWKSIDPFKIAMRTPACLADESIYAGPAEANEHGNKQHIITLV